MLEKYCKITYTHKYVMGAKENNKVVAYFIELEVEGLEKMFTAKTTSRGYKVVRYASTKKKRAYLTEHCEKRVELCTVEEFENSRRKKTSRLGKEYVENRGEYFEYLIAEKFSGIQNLVSNLKHTDGGDIEIEDIPYQVKFEGAGIYL
jgi:hypothetical protein